MKIKSLGQFEFTGIPISASIGAIETVGVSNLLLPFITTGVTELSADLSGYVGPEVSKVGGGILDDLSSFAKHLFLSPGSTPPPTGGGFFTLSNLEQIGERTLLPALLGGGLGYGISALAGGEAGGAVGGTETGSAAPSGGSSGLPVASTPSGAPAKSTSTTMLLVLGLAAMLLFMRKK